MKQKKTKQKNTKQKKTRKQKKILIVYYSRTGTTKKVAEALAKTIGCEIETIKDTKDWSGVKGYLLAGRDATKRKLTELQTAEKDPSAYDLVIVGTPIWSWNLSVPVRTYLEQNKKKFKEIAFFCTQGGSGAERACKELKLICDKEPSANLALLTKEVVAGTYDDKLASFVKLLIK